MLVLPVGCRGMRVLHGVPCGTVSMPFRDRSPKADRGDSCAAAEGEPSPSPLGVQGDGVSCTACRAGLFLCRDGIETVPGPASDIAAKP